MMDFQQACAYVRATGSSAYCYTPWMHEGEWIGVQHCTLYEPAGAGDATPLEMRLRRVARGARGGEVIEVGSLAAWDELPAQALEAQYGVDPRGYRYAASDADADAADTQAYQAASGSTHAVAVPGGGQP
ncbi:hypothetical protein M8A51_13745 [Schlegelella sp. S2-27]|uniref:Uncharacterized protein n=1 Tax=Caldimonas mangrovi TaxID=2944811 RepID=A0ABT0YPE9_9BURK|nr:hypothetical protein [Caldimonas mangrovi]MCM5680591.1 hypothetical protein [Caldimonas mangrovi]